MTGNTAMDSNLNRVLILAEDYQFLDTVHWSGPCAVQEWQVASTLEQVEQRLTPTPFAIVLDLEAPSIDPTAALELLGRLQVSAKIVLLKSSDLRKLTNAYRTASAAALEIAGTLERPLMMSALSKLLVRHASGTAPIEASELKQAIAAGELLLHYQPIVARQGGTWLVRGVEALVRWQHPQRGLLYPGQFLKVAESGDLLPALTDFVMEAALRQSGLWHGRGLELTMAINLAPSLVRDGGFLERFMRALRLHGVPPEHVMLEVIEAVSLQDRELVRDVLSRLRMQGVALSLDDFGTGFSSLTELCRLPFNEIKIDRALIHDVPEVREASTVVAAIIGLAHRLSMRVCGEGVETQAAFDFLAESGCDSMQGVLFAPPVPAEDIDALVAKGIEHAPLAVTA